MSYFANSSNIEVEVLDGTARLEKNGDASTAPNHCRVLDVGLIA